MNKLANLFYDEGPSQSSGKIIASLITLKRTLSNK
jgi:hypothetical protein